MAKLLSEVAMKYLILSLFFLSSCQTVGVIKSGDPRVKIKDGYRLLSERRSLPAALLFNEAFEITQENSDLSMKATALVALGDVYKFKDGGAQSTSTYDFQKSISSYDEAAKILNNLKFNQRLAMAYWGMAQAYAQEKKIEKSCDYLNKAARAYYDPSGGADDQLQLSSITTVLPYFEKSKKQKFKLSCSDK